MHRRTSWVGLIAAFGLLAPHPGDALESAGGEAQRVARAALERFQNGLDSGNWQAFTAMLGEHVNVWYPENDDYDRWIPAEEPRYLIGRDAAVRFFTRMGAAYRPGSFRFTEVFRESVNASTVVFEAHVVATLPDGRAFGDRLAISIDLCGEQVCSWRQYFGSDGHATSDEPMGTPAAPVGRRATAGGATGEQAHLLLVAMRGADAFQRGLYAGDWKEFFGMLDENVNFWFPTKRAAYIHAVGKAAMVAFFTEMNDGTKPSNFRVRFIDPLRLSVGASHVVLETRVHAEQADGKVVYRNRVLLSWDICGERICTYREYFGSDRKSN